MGTMTAQILVGQSHSYDGGLVNHTHTLFLSENDAPAWLLVPQVNRSQPTTQFSQRIVWIPTPEYMLEDGILMAALYAIKDPTIIELTEKYLPTSNYREPLEVYRHIPEDRLTQLHHHVRQLNTHHKIILTIHNGSSLSRQLDVIRGYENWDVEVCVSKYVKERSGFGPVLVDEL